jgi:hypothetical protein
MSRKLRRKPIAKGAALPRAKGFTPPSPKRRTGRLLIVLAGIIAGQAILYGPSLVGERILLPLDLLAVPGVYLPKTPEAEEIVPHDVALSDLVLQFEPERRFSATEIHAGRFPMWTTYQYAGSPLVWPKFSPFILLGCLVLSPVILPWVQLLAAITSGLGFYLFCRRALGVGYWAATIPAWCYPMTGFFVFWQGFPTCGAAYWFPWLLLAVDRTVRRSSQIGWAGLSAVTALVLISGHIDVAGQALLASGLYAAWCLWDAYGRQWYQAQARTAIIALAAGWCLGFLLAAPHLLPLLEYAQTGARMEHRSGGEEERPPVGLSDLPQTVLPDMYGATRAGSVRIPPGNQIESSAAIYAGVFATLLVAPLAWCSRRHRSFNVFCSLLIFLGLSWCVNVPGVVDLLRLPGLNMMSHNRLVFVGSLAILAMTSIGLEALLRREVSRRRWFFLPGTILAALGLWCLFRVYRLPDPIAASQQWAIQMWFIRSYSIAGLLCGLGVAGWVLLSSRNISRPWFVPALGILLVGDLLWFAHNRSAQSDPALYYPRIPVLEEIARSTAGRIIGYNCLPATLAQTHELRDIRGYDSVDPGRLMALMGLAADPRSQVEKYAMTQFFLPRTEFVQDGIKLPPVLDMLSVRYVIYRGTPPPQIPPAFRGNDYWALINHAALPRAFIPRRVEMVADDSERLGKLASAQFDPRAVAYVESFVNLPDECRGEAEISAEIPTRVTVSVKMETPGLVVLTDLWDKGWRAYLNGQPVPILRANHAVRGVLVPAGLGTVEFRYESASLTLGIKLAILAAIILLSWLVIVARRADNSELVTLSGQKLLS